MDGAGKSSGACRLSSANSAKGAVDSSEQTESNLFARIATKFHERLRLY